MHALSLKAAQGAAWSDGYKIMVTMLNTMMKITHVK